MIYLLTAIGLSPGGSTYLHTNNTQNNTNNNRTTQITNNVEECGPCPVFASFTQVEMCITDVIKPLKAKLNPICHLLALLGAHHIFHVCRIRVKESVDFQWGECDWSFTSNDLRMELQCVTRISFPWLCKHLHQS
jgi:hypothetical protein